MMMMMMQADRMNGVDVYQKVHSRCLILIIVNSPFESGVESTVNCQAWRLRRNGLYCFCEILKRNVHLLQLILLVSSSRSLCMCVNQQREEVVGVEGNWLPFIWYVNSLFYLFFSSFSLYSPHLLHRPLFYGCLPSFSKTPSRDDDPCINECNYIHAHLYMGSKQYVLSKDKRYKKKSKRKQWHNERKED